MHRKDDDLIQSYLSGDMAAFEILYRRYAARLVGFLHSLGSAHDTAQELAQKTWVKAIDAFERYQRQGKFRPFLFKIARNLWLDEVRSAWHRKRIALPENPDEEGWSHMQMKVHSESLIEYLKRMNERDMVNESLLELPDTMRQTILLRIDGELTFREIALEMDCKLSTTIWRWNEGQSRLVQLLQTPIGEEK